VIVNLTPHPLHFYPSDCPDRIDERAEDAPAPLFSLPPSGAIARIETQNLGTWFTDRLDDRVGPEVSVEGVEYGHASGLPPLDTDAWDLNLRPRTYYVVPLVVALATRGRPDLLVPYRDVRSHEGTVLGCRQLARPC
jgi:hypothetical protein